MLLLGGGILSGCQLASPTPRVDIITTLGPLESLISSIAGPTVTVSSIIPPGVSPHDFEPTPKDVARIQSATLVFRIGNGFDDWMDPFLEGKRSIALSDGIADIVDPHDPSVINPHVWVSPKRVLQMIPRIRAALASERIFNLSTSDLDQRATQMMQTIEAIENEYVTTIAKFRSKQIIAVHEAWVYLAQDYGLTIAWTIEPVPGQEPSAQDILSLRSIIQERGISSIFSEPQLSQESIMTISRDLGVRVIELIPEGSREVSTLEGVLRFNLQQLEKGLGS